MIINTSVNANKFIFCSVYQSPNETSPYFNEYDAHYHSGIYMLEGSLVAYLSDTETIDENTPNDTITEGNFYDISYTRGKYITSKTGATGASMIMFNPVPASKNLDVKIVKNKQTLEINTSDTPITVVCITGPVNINGKELKSLQFATVYENKSATLTLDDNNICAIVTG
jgi:hypothetical protein